MAFPRPDGPPLPFAGLAEHLTALRRAARLSQLELAAAAAVSRGTVQRAESGATAPSTAVLDSLARACGGDQAAQGRAHVLRMRGRTEQRGRLRGLKAPAPGLVHTAQDLGAALAAEYERAGAPPMSRFFGPAEGHKPIPRTTAWRIIRRQGLPADAEQLQTFLDVCRVSRSSQRHYREAYGRLAPRRKCSAPPRHTVRRTPVAVPVRGIDKIPQYYRDLLDVMPEENIETVLAFGIAHFVAGQAYRNGTAPPHSLNHVMQVAVELFVEANRLPVTRDRDVRLFDPYGPLMETKESAKDPGMWDLLTRLQGRSPVSGGGAAWVAKGSRGPESRRAA
ncbi:helix-turn-helix domain-containing protein [Streptomyces sp. CB02400]|uniref:helix-turn-helix domain-containing protein n=1 Tax=Streptomyces sp. CB02400 TaxID=1703944 RepID=UPI00093AA728|nr:helix-turn-helix transcriptional regulator [Streptomyces sp. CB02400]